ncbi:hypothetical protein CW703_04550 [Candidatus Bathyarchaeota archaeon]|nr:MAG: hypothetical protein B6U77_01405 [Candidatus Hecatellales archaeon ex4484_218]RJX15772.1 MAG: hypothetical protein CW703_04550 [Candidatus Bathyarchaeota archaeon]
MKLEEKKTRIETKFIRVPLIIHTILKRDNSFTLQIEHMQVRRTSINIPKNIINLGSEEIEEYIKEVYPNAKSFVIQYEERDGEIIPFCAQLFVSGRKERKY